MRTEVIISPMTATGTSRRGEIAVRIRERLPIMMFGISGDSRDATDVRRGRDRQE